MALEGVLEASRSKGREGLKTLHRFKAISLESMLVRCTTRYHKTGIVSDEGVSGGKVGGSEEMTFANSN
jgi:hypothetical protein